MFPSAPNFLTEYSKTYKSLSGAADENKSGPSSLFSDKSLKVNKILLSLKRHVNTTTEFLIITNVPKFDLQNDLEKFPEDYFPSGF